ncbi:flagellar hook-length control protein FliK [Clostridium tetani]|uniref:Rhoptry protein n=1 Tax=Clostridium tetani TaxID=1513 RepID=A0ABY0EVY6_CLOTA|nr:flagellar hook-length control protein FliK [Clostridium tetani]CDI48390.1 Flagellar hook-length control protein FliK [Clostridium tetani 12124569]KHO40146.1 hypothetical protein OR62_01560 [Clostridium tetani]RXI41018.1 hypothetical protein DP129_02460 [Clostridium tetani]RXI58565.1 hypothetical protein DP131_01380 [Clostridium tetani]RXI73277.1 hypothetical protein DQN76_02865 [Clostridium tetani]
MAGILNVNDAYNINLKRITNKLSFQIGEVFLARVMSLGEENEDILLRLLDGWQFPAQLKEHLDFQPTGLIRFKVEGFKDGKLQLMILDARDPEEKLKEDSIEGALRRENIALDKKDYTLLEKIVKHNMPLTKENISNIKNLTEMINRFSKDGEEANSFIEKYIESRNISIDSKEGEFIKNTLKGFFKELSTLEEDDILTMLENGVDITEDNIRSFNSLYKESSLYNKVKGLEDILKESKVLSQNIQDGKEILKENTNPEQNILEQKVVSVTDNISKDTLESKDKIIDNKNEVIGEKEIETLSKENTKKIIEDGKNTLYRKEEIVKEQINSKIEDMKSIIKDLLDSKTHYRLNDHEKLFGLMKQELNDFKVFNTLSNQYYYLDLPVNVNKDEYECKLIIKDERKKGKKIDKQNVKIATSIKTINMGIVDAFIGINKNVMNVDIKAEELWINILKFKKQQLLNALEDKGYNVYMNVSKKEEDFNLSNCSDFFEDKNINAIDLKV